jgi:hypothetical protein
MYSIKTMGRNETGLNKRVYRDIDSYSHLKSCIYKNLAYKKSPRECRGQGLQVQPQISDLYEKKALFAESEAYV